MPFERYLRADPYYYQEYDNAFENAHTNPVQFQIPQLMLDGPPILAPGGGAEVLPAGLLDSTSDSFASSWFANNGFAPFHSRLSPPTSAPGHSHRLHSNFIDSRQQPLPEPPPSLDPTSTLVPSSPHPTSYSLLNALVPNPALSLPVPSRPPIGLSVYSASGFDVLSILSRVVNRPNQTVQLGPVDLSCSFVIVDVRRFDCPIVYASPTFCHLTGYSEQEVLGRNCRFLQSPTGHVTKGEPRRFVSHDAVSHMRKSLASSKECQTTLINYRKGGKAFINLITVIPLRGGVHNTPEEADEVVYHIGFQVDLTEQPNRVLDKLRNSSWATSNVRSSSLPGVCHGLGQLAQAQNMTNIGTKGGRHGQMMSIAVSKELRNLIADTTFTDSVPISVRTNMSGPTNTAIGSGEQSTNRTMPLTMLLTPPSSSTSTNRTSSSGNTTSSSIPLSLSPSLSLFLLEFLPDFLLVLSLKGAFLYAAPSVRLVLGYEPEDLVGKSISDVCHPADLVPLMRELKEGSVSGLNVAGTTEVGSSMGSNLVPKSVDLLFRALPKISTEPPYSQTQEASADHGNSHSSSSSETFVSDDVSDVSTPPYVWLECRGRLHIEPGKGRKAIILSGRARWMPVVRWSSIHRAGGLGCSQRYEDAYRTVQDSRPSEASRGETPRVTSVDPLEFWALLSSQGTFLVASATVRDMLGWGTSEVIGRSIWGMVRDGRSGLRESIEIELARLEASETESMTDPPPTVVTTTLAHRECHLVPVRLTFYRTPWSRKYAPSSSSKSDAPTSLIHPLNNPLCPIVCQVTLLSNTECPTEQRHGSGSRKNIGSDSDESPTHLSSASLFEELEASRGTSWQYELQQLKFANQRLHEELSVLEACTGRDSGSSSGPMGTQSTVRVPFGHSCSPFPSTTSQSITPQSTLQLQQTMSQMPANFTLLRHSSHSTSFSPHPTNSLHEPDPPSSEWSSLAGANGQGTNSLKRSWRSEDGLMA